MRFRYPIRLSLQVVVLAGLLLAASGSARPAGAGSFALASASSPASPPAPSNTPDDFPPDPTSDIPSSNNIIDLASLQTTFNNARSVENSQLGTSVPALTVPSQATWNGFTNSEKALWLINRERLDRGLIALHGVESNVTGVAQNYANYLLNNNTWGHTANGQDPWERLNSNPAINACHDFLGIAENLSVAVSSVDNLIFPVERAVYGWMYEDAGSAWGHRHAILWFPYEDNSGASNKEGFLGIGVASGGPYKGPFSESWDFATLVVMNVFDPCATWTYSDPPPPPPPVGDKFLFLAISAR